MILNKVDFKGFPLENSNITEIDYSPTSGVTTVTLKDIASFVKNKDKSFESLQSKVESWASDRNLILGSDPKSQFCKLIQEIGEFSDAMCKNKLEETKDEFGDILVVMIILAKQLNINPVECLAIAYDKIKDRKGVMRSGVFIKEADL